MKKGAITNMDNLETAFKATGGNHFTVYYGDNKLPGFVTIKNNHISDPSESWDYLREQLEIRTAGGGLFTIFIPNGEKSAHGTTLKYEAQSLHQNTHSMAGIGSPMSGIGEYVNIAVQSAKQEMMLQRLEEKMEDLENENELLRKGDGINGWLNTVLTPETVTPLLQGIAGIIAAKFMPGRPPAVAGVTTQGFTPAQDADHTDHESEIEISDASWEAITSLQTQLGDEFENTIKMLAWYIKTNPGMIVTLRGMIKPSYDAAH